MKSPPQYLREKVIWMHYRAQPKNGRVLKLPINRRGIPASIHKMQLYDYAAAVELLPKVPGASGLGFVLKAADDLVVADIDKVNVDDRMKLFIKHAGTYAEVSPSGIGIHLIFKDEEHLKPTLVKRAAKLEVYSKARFITWTGDRISRERNIKPNIDLIRSWHRQSNADLSFDKIPEIDYHHITDVDTLNIHFDLKQRVIQTRRGKDVDMSSVCYHLAKELLASGVSERDVLGLFNNRNYGINELTTSRGSGLTWIYKYVIRPQELIISGETNTLLNRNFKPPSKAFEKLVDGYLETAIYPVESFAVASVLAALSTIFSNAFEFEGVRSNLYLCLHTATAGGKQHALTYAKHLVKGAGFRQRVYAEVQSDVALEAVMQEEPNVLLLLDEFVHFVSKMQSSTWARAFKSCLLKLYTAAAHDYICSVAYSRGKGKRVEIESPCVNMLAAAITEELARAACESDLVDGFFNRIILVEGALAKPAARPAKLDSLTFDELKVYQFNPGEITQVKCSDAVSGLFYNALLAQSNNIDKLQLRVVENAKKLALIVAVLDNFERPKISAALAEWALAFTDACAKRASDLLVSSAATAYDDRDRRDLIRVKQGVKKLLAEPQLYALNKASELAKAKLGLMSSYRLYRLLRMTSQRVNYLLQTLVASREISLESAQRGGANIKLNQETT